MSATADDPQLLATSFPPSLPKRLDSDKEFGSTEEYRRSWVHSGHMGDGLFRDQS